jgi:hypothetical protein
MSDDSESQGQQGWPKELLHVNQASKNSFILVFFVTKKDKVYYAGRIKDRDGTDNKVLFWWWHGNMWQFMFPEKDDGGAVASTHSQGRLAAPIEGDSVTWFASFMVMPVGLTRVNVK